MKPTGIVRKLDDLGRVVVPKEIRRTLRIREGDPLEIYTDSNGEVIFRKYSPLGDLATFAAEYAETLHKTCSLSVIIADRDAVIATAGVSRKEYADKRLSDELEKLMEARGLFVRREGTAPLSPIADGGSHCIRCAMPIIAEGDIVGCVCSLGTESDDRRGNMEVETKLIQTAAGFLAKQFES